MRAALLMIAVLAFWAPVAAYAEPASAAEMPKELRGTWCAKEPPNQTYARCRQYGGEQDLMVDARGMSNGEVGCKPRSIVLDGNGYRIIMRCVRFVASSGDEWSTSERWRLFNNGRRLEIRDARPGGRGKARP